ncbi:MAG: outer membrane beta-barrel protein [Candidatus Sulfotelmatobacter sp.]
MRKFALLTTVLACLFFTHFATAQQGDAMFGFGTLLSSGSSSCSISNFSTCVGPEKGGLYTNLSGDVIFHKRVGFNFEAAWRTKQGLDTANGGQLYRPILFDFNGVYQPRLSKKVGADLFGGIGWQTTRFYGYQATTNCLVFGSCYTSNNHFLVDIGAGLRYYVFGHVFVRPEAHYYHILNNTDVFSSNNVVRVGASIGYTIGGPE